MSEWVMEYACDEVVSNRDALCLRYGCHFDIEGEGPLHESALA